VEESKELIVSKQNSFIAPVVDIQSAIARYSAFHDFVSQILKEGTDFGKIPGTDKPTLLKPGAEKLGAFFGLRPIFSIQESINDWTGSEHAGEAFFFREYKCQLYRNGELIGEGIGSCNSWEKKYRYRKLGRKCPNCGNETIIKGKAEYGGGWLCYTKKGGCGEKFQDDDERIIRQETGQVPNPDVADQVNTIDKMAQKRAFIAAILIATNASEYFTQDMEDFAGDVVEAEFIEQKPATKKDDKETHSKKVKYFTPEQIQAIIGAFPEEKIEANHASAMLSLSQKLTSETPVDLTVRWALKYRVESKKSGDKHLAADIADSEILGN